MVLDRYKEKYLKDCGICAISLEELKHGKIDTWCGCQIRNIQFLYYKEEIVSAIILVAKEEKDFSVEDGLVYAKEMIQLYDIIHMLPIYKNRFTHYDVESDVLRIDAYDGEFEKVEETESEDRNVYIILEGQRIEIVHVENFPKNQQWIEEYCKLEQDI